MKGGSNSPEAIKSVRIQTSSYGVCRFLVYGTNRITTNVIWVNDLQAIAQEQGK